jgi:predicted metal-binding protein
MDIAKYQNLSKEYGLLDILLISSEDIVLDSRAILKCRWGCDYSISKNIKCETHGLSIEERKNIIKSYGKAFLLHNNNDHELSKACLGIERELFLDGYYFAFTLKGCNYCKECSLTKGLDCAHPDKVRPCDQMFGIDVYKTVRNLGLPINVLRSKDETQNRYGFVLIE